MLVLWIILGVILFLILAIVIWAIGTFNALVRMRNNVEEAFSTMDVYMKKRYDLVPNLVATVKGYAKHESETLEKVISARNMALNATTVEEKAEGEQALTSSLRELRNIVFEKYPDLKANTNFLDLQNQLKNIEGEIANSRKYYNACVKTYNVKIEVFPSSIIANMKKFEKKVLFTVEDPEERKAVKVEF